MYQKRFVVRTKLTPPRPHKYILTRPRLTRRLLEVEAYRLTIVQAGTGYGKSTAVAALATADVPLVWYHLAREDADPHVFLLHLLHGFAAVLDDFSEAPLVQLEEWERQRTAEGGLAVVDSLINALAVRLEQPFFLVLDDAHLLNDAAETLHLLDRLISHAPYDLHPILATRYPLDLPNLVTWRVRGQLLEIGQEELAFTPAEIARLFDELYGLALTGDQVDLLARRIEGWPIALPLVWQHLQRGRAALPEAIGRLSGSAGDLFTFLAQEVLAQQPQEVQEFLRVTSVLRDLTAGGCDALRDAADSDFILQYLHDHNLFVVSLGDGHSRYHHLFRAMLRNQLPPHEARAAHLRAAAIYQARGDLEEGVYHFLLAEAYGEAAEILSDWGREMVRVGRLDTLAAWLSDLPPDVLAGYPNLLTYMGDIARLHSRFDEALGWYQQAETYSHSRGDRQALGQALRGQARVYLDTVNPSQAEQLLQEALRLSDGHDDRESRARLLNLMAENLLNQGRFKEAEQYQTEARRLLQEGPSEVELPVRLLLRTGRLDEARAILEKQVEIEQKEPVLRPRAHRETLLLLSIVLAFQGERERAYACAVAGTKRGEALNSHFITAVGLSRQGHAWLLQKDEAGYEQARRCFQEAIELSETLMVPRLKVEAYWGLVQAYGFRGDLAQAHQAAVRGIDIATKAGDEWIVAGLRLALGAGYVLAERDEAAEWLAQAGTGFHECGDMYGQTVTRLWQCLLWHGRGDTTRLERDGADLLRLVRTHRYAFVFERPILLGPPDPRALVPLLIFTRERELQAPYARRLLSQIGVDAAVETHPGYQLRVQTLGAFRVWRGREELAGSAWKRQKARQLFQLLVTYRHTLLEREQIVDKLWPELDPDSGERDFKIAYTTLCKVLEPGRDRKAPVAYILRDGSRYGLRPEADLWLDAAEFDRLVGEGDRLFVADIPAALACYRQALALYGGEFLQEYPYEEWCSEERERLLIDYLRTAERLARALLAQEAWAETIEVCDLILARDDCWEQAYRMLMRAHAALGNRSQALRAYQRCVERLEAELDVAPSAVTVQLHETILQVAGHPSRVSKFS